MPVKLEKINQVKLSGKGILVALDDEGFHIEDTKEGVVEVIALEDIKALLLGKEISINFTNKEADIE